MNDQRVAYPNEIVWEGIFNSVVEEAAKHTGPKHFEPLDYLHGAEYPGHTAAVRNGASYKSLAYIGHLMGMDGKEREQWYRVAQCLPLSQAHAGIIIARLNDSKQMISGLEQMLQAA